MARKTLYYIHVHQQRIRQNIKIIKTGGTEKDLKPPMTVKKGKSQTIDYGFEFDVGPGKFKYKPDGSPILGCGARVAFETEVKPIKVR